MIVGHLLLGVLGCVIAVILVLVVFGYLRLYLDFAVGLLGLV